MARARVRVRVARAGVRVGARLDRGYLGVVAREGLPRSDGSRRHEEHVPCLAPPLAPLLARLERVAAHEPGWGVGLGSWVGWGYRVGLGLGGYGVRLRVRFRVRVGVAVGVGVGVRVRVRGASALPHASNDC